MIHEAIDGPPALRRMAVSLSSVTWLERHFETVREPLAPRHIRHSAKPQRAATLPLPSSLGLT